MKNLLLLLKTSRPFGWIIAPIVFLIGISSSSAELTFLPILQILLLSFPYCVFLYGVNDVYDYESDRLNPRKKLVEGIKLKPRYHSFVKRVSYTIALLMILTSLFSLNITNILGIFLLLFFSYFYSAPPLRFKEKPLLDSFSNGILYFFAPFVMGFSFNDTILDIPIKTYLITACVMGIHSFSTIMDYSIDKKVGDKTFAVVFGKRMASLFALVIFVLTLIFAKFETAIINYYLIFCTVLFLIISIFPSEKLASLSFKLVFIGFIITTIIFLIG